MSRHIEILQIPPALLTDMAPHVGPHLARGLPGSGREAMDVAADVARDHAQVWAIFVDRRVAGAFLTAILVEEGGRRSLDVFGLAGSGILAWGKRLADRMVDFARANDCQRVVFAGRKGLQKAYGNLTVIDRRDDSTLIYERAA